MMRHSNISEKQCHNQRSAFAEAIEMTVNTMHIRSEKRTELRMRGDQLNARALRWEVNRNFAGVSRRYWQYFASQHLGRLMVESKCFGSMRN
jgi:hypothetical protein